MTGKDPGQLGFYGFRNRGDYTYEELVTANSNYVREPRLWDLLSADNKSVITVAVPQTYPPKPVNGSMVSCFLTPSTQSEYTFPTELKREVEAVTGGYMLDADGFRDDDKERIRREVFDMTEKRFRLINHMMTTKKWDFFMSVEIGVDRIHHAFWKYSDPKHRKYEPGHPYENVILDYYRLIDRRLGETLANVDNNTVVFVVSDHGAQAMEGGFCLNEWLIREGYLRLKEEPDGVVPIGKAKVDWTKTVAWGAGGYYGRLFLNVKDREPYGVVPAKDYERVRDELREKLGKVTDEKGEHLGTEVYKPEEIYNKCLNIPPDLIVYFGGLGWRSVGSVGHQTIHVFENDTGPDDANHSQHGIFIKWDPKRRESEVREGLSIFDCAPTILSAFSMRAPDGMAGQVIR